MFCVFVGGGDYDGCLKKKKMEEFLIDGEILIRILGDCFEFNFELFGIKRKSTMANDVLTYKRFWIMYCFTT